MRREPWLAEMCRRITEGEEVLKGKLPVWTPSCAGFKDNHRSIADALKPLQRLMLDFDEKGHSAEILEKSLQLQKQGKWEILLVEESVRKGTHVLITLPEGMTPQEAQIRFSEEVGFQADPALKDVARCIYMVPEANTLYVNEALFEPVEATVVQGEEKNPEDIKNEQADSRNEYPQTYEEIPYADVVEVLEEQMGGKPDVGSRNNFIFSMACHMRYICDDNPSWIAQVLPTYGEEQAKFEGTVRSACQRIQTKAMPRIVKRTLAICKQRKEEEAYIRNQTASGDTPPELPKRLPPLIRLLLSRTPKVYQPAVACAVFPALGAHLWKTTFRYIDNCLYEATLANLLLAPTGSGKSCVNTPIDYIMADIRERDRLSMEKERRWKQEVSSKGSNKDKRVRPEGIIIQEIDPDSTSAAFVQRMADAEGRFLYARMNEIEQLTNLSSRGNSRNVFDLLCLAFDYGNVYGQTRVGTASVSERVCVRFNYNVSTTVRKGQAFFSRVLTDGPLSRIGMCTIPEREIGAEMPVYGTYDEDFAAELKPYISNIISHGLPPYKN